jgi:hypothetical protein
MMSLYIATPLFLVAVIVFFLWDSRRLSKQAVKASLSPRNSPFPATPSRPAAGVVGEGAVSPDGVAGCKGGSGGPGGD